MTEFREEGHLGGYIVGGDPATFYPLLWKWMALEYRSVLDLGCGEGHSLRAMRDYGLEVWGIDGVDQPQLGDLFCQLDFTKAWNIDFPVDFVDAVWCCEVAEHIEEQYLPNLLSYFIAEYVYVTHAGPGQQGYHHVNCQSADYWHGAMAAIGYQQDVGLTNVARSLAADNTDPNNHFVRSGLVFRRHKE